MFMLVPNKFFLFIPNVIEHISIWEVSERPLSSFSWIPYITGKEETREQTKWFTWSYRAWCLVKTPGFPTLRYYPFHFTKLFGLIYKPHFHHQHNSILFNLTFPSNDSRWYLFTLKNLSIHMINQQLFFSLVFTSP